MTTTYYTSRPDTPGGYNVDSETTSAVRYLYMAKQGIFEIVVNGLLPSTLHQLFFEKNKVANTNIKPLHGAIGDPIFTDRNGIASFVFYYNSDQIAASTEDIYIEYAQRMGGDKQLVLAACPSDLTTLPDNYMSAFNSVAAKSIFFKTSKASELPINTNYSFSYPEDPPVVADPSPSSDGPDREPNYDG